MNSKRDLICIGCPIGCPLQVTIEENIVTKVSGNICKRGQIYAEKECANPTRILTSTVQVRDGVAQVVPVKTAQDVPKDKIHECANLLRNIIVQAPIKLGDIILKDIAGTGVDVIATKNVDCI